MEAKRNALGSLALSLAFASGLFAAESDTGATALTIYSAASPGSIPPELYRSGGRGQAVPGYAVVRQQRSINLNRGRNTVRFADVAAYIDPTTVTFESLTDAAGTRVIEQNFQFDLVNHEKLLARYIDQPVKVDQVRGTGVESFTGTLLSTSGGMILRREDGSVQLLPHNAGVTLPNLPGGLITARRSCGMSMPNRAVTIARAWPIRPPELRGGQITIWSTARAPTRTPAN